MPIQPSAFQEGIFACQMIGRIDEHDAQKWLSLLSERAEQANTPIVALIDATQTTSINAAARRIIAHAGSVTNLNSTSIATHHYLVSQHLQLVLLMSVNKQMYVYKTWKEAECFALNRAALLADVEEVMA